MSSKTKQRVRARMTRTGEAYQAAWNALHFSEAALAAPRPFQWRCDICGEDLLDDPRSGMVAWLYEPDPRPPLEYVGALFFCHKGTCDEVVRDLASTFGVSDSWVELIMLVNDKWYDSSQSLVGGKRWSDSHTERLAMFFRAVSSARERGWRPSLTRGASEPVETFRRKDLARERALTVLGEGLDDRVRACFAPESTILEGERR